MATQTDRLTVLAVVQRLGCGKHTNLHMILSRVNEAYPEGISSLSRLADKDVSIIPENGAKPIKEIRCQLQADWDISQLLNSLPACQCCVIRSAACHKHHSSASPDGWQVALQTP